MVEPGFMAQPKAPTQRLSKLELEMMAGFERETRRLKDEVEKMPEGLGKKLLGQEVDLRERRLQQWKDNPSGEPEPGARLTEY